MSKEFKVVESIIQPNHKEAEIWVTPPQQDGSKEVKIYNQKSLTWVANSTNENILHVIGFTEPYGLLTIVDVCINLDSLEIILNNSIVYRVDGGENDPEITSEPYEIELLSWYDDDLESTVYEITSLSEGGDTGVCNVLWILLTKESDWEFKSTSYSIPDQKIIANKLNIVGGFNSYDAPYGKIVNSKRNICIMFNA